MATCENDHDPITFEGEFRALCPLCAMRLELLQAVEAAEEETRKVTELGEQETHDAEKERDEVQEKLDKMEEERDTLSAESDSLLAALKGLEAGGCWCEAGIGNPMMAGRHSEACEAAKDAIHEAERRRKN